MQFYASAKLLKPGTADYSSSCKAFESVKYDTEETVKRRIQYST